MDETAESIPAEDPPQVGADGPVEKTEPTTGPGVAILLAFAAVATAVIGGRAAFLSADASSNWQASIREQVKQAAAYVEDIRYLYTVETPQAVQTAQAQARAQELGRAAQSSTGLNQSLLTVEQSIEQNVVKTLTPNFPLTADPKYATPGGGYDIGRRLADIRNENPDLVALDPARTARVGDHFAVRSIRLVASTVLIGGAFLFGSLAQGFSRRRGLFLGIGTTLLIAGVAAAVVVEAVA
jgi:hypothetical protein